MKERRKHKRRKLAEHLAIYLDSFEQPFGQLLDFTPKGLMMRTDQPVTSKVNFRFYIILPGRFFGFKEISFDAQSIWCRRNESSNSYHAGFKLSSLDEKDIASIRQFILQFERVY